MINDKMIIIDRQTIIYTRLRYSELLLITITFKVAEKRSRVSRNAKQRVVEFSVCVLCNDNRPNSKTGVVER